MSSSIRQSNLFAAEDYQKIFQAYQFIDYTAYDFDTLKQALVNYVQTYYPEDFNDYIESSEFIAIIELIAYLGTSLAFRTDLNSRENFIDTATRRESIIRLAQMVNYVPRRNICASGLFKIAAVETDQLLIDANGNAINNVSIFWNDPNNPDWFDQFVQICNAAFSTVNPFGRPSQSGTIGSIPTDLYQLNNVLNLNVAYPTTTTINGQVYPIDICNPNFISGQTIFERPPDPANPFNFIYRNDSLGVASNNTGFFLYFKQGALTNIDTNFNFPVPSQLFNIDIQNINQSDVYVQETDQQGNVLAQWTMVPQIAGQNIIYNSIQNSIRNIYSVITGVNDTVTVSFADGNFGNVPTGLFRFWVRVSANQNLVIQPSAVQNQQITIPYISSDNQQYNLTITYSLEQTIGNAAASETNEQVQLRAPEVFSTQSRMVNGSDYNVLPLIYGNQIAKLQAIDRTYSGMSRYIDLNDPTGFHKDLIIFGQDGALYRDDQDVSAQVLEDVSNSGNIDTIVIDAIQEMLVDPKLAAFYLDAYLPQFEATVRVNPPNTGRSLLDLVPTVGDPSQPLFWKTSPTIFKNDTGFFSTSTGSSTAVALTNTLTSDNTNGLIYEPWGFIKTGAVIQLGNTSIPSTLNSVSVDNVIQNGLPTIVNPANPYANIGPVALSENEQNNFQATKVYPPLRTTLTSTEIAAITAAINNGISFYMYYDLLSDEWGVSTAATAGISDQSQQPFAYPPSEIVGGHTQIYAGPNWSTLPYGPPSGLIYVNIATNNQTGVTTFDLTGRGRIYVFESYRDVQFYWEPGQIVIDNSTGLALQDNIEIMPFVNTNSSIDNNLPPSPIPSPQTAFLTNEVSFNISGVFTQADGYVDPSKVQVSLIDTNTDGIPDDPNAFDDIVAPTDRIVFEYYSNQLTGYQNTRPWVATWGTQLANSTGNLYVYFPMTTPGTDTTLYSPPYITDTIQPSATAPSLGNFVYLSDADLVFINNLAQITFDTVNPWTITIPNQVSAFFNNVSTGTNTVITAHFPWLTGTQTVTGKAGILADYFTGKSFLLSSISPPGYGVYYALSTATTANLTTYPTGTLITSAVDSYHFDKNGKVFTQNTSVPTNQQLPLYFKWSHYAPLDQRVDPSATNIIDMIVITNSYYSDMTNWAAAGGTLLTMPAAPTTEELRIQFQDLDQYKMLSDDMVWNSGTFKLLFGPQAAAELQAKFVVVKSTSTTVSDNEVRTQVIAAINAYFDIRNWDFGEAFYFSELAAFIHQQLITTISTIVIVPTDTGSAFGNLFEIIPGPTQLFLSTATVNNVQIVTTLTNQNLGIQ